MRPHPADVSRGGTPDAGGIQAICFCLSHQGAGRGVEPSHTRPSDSGAWSHLVAGPRGAMRIGRGGLGGQGRSPWKNDSKSRAASITRMMLMPDPVGR
jgi:hypothetical protein